MKKNSTDYFQQHINEIVSANLRSIIDQKNTTQKELAEYAGIAPATMSDYCNGRRLPSVEFLVSLKSLYNVSIDDFVTKDLSLTSVQKNSCDESSIMTNEVCSKLVGTYFIYYFDTSKYKGRDNKIPRDSLLYGILYLYESYTAFDTSCYESVAVLGIKTSDDAKSLYKRINLYSNAADAIDFISKEYPSTAYYGEIDASQEHIFINLFHSSTDKALIILHRVDGNNHNYLGGIGTINSVSKGRERMPVIQFIGLSRYPLDMTEEEIHQALLLQYPDIEISEDADEMIEEFKALFCEDGVKSHTFSEHQKSLFFKSILSRYVRKSLEQNVFRYGKISEKDDDDWYHAIKQPSDSE